MKRELVTHLDPKAPVSETFRTLRTNIQFMNSNRRLRTLLVTSTMPGEGKSWIASNLAVTFAQAGKRVALIDADMRKGRLYSIFGIEPRPGLSNYLSGYNENQDSVIDIDKYLRKTDVNNLFLMPAGNIPPNPSELLVRRQMKVLIEQLKNRVDLTIIDGTPSKLVTDSVILSRIVDSTIVVSAHNQTRKDDLERVVKDIKNVGGNIAGVVYNKIPVSSKKYNQTYYYSSNVTTTKNQPDYEAERRKLQQRTQNALSQNSRRSGNHSEINRTSQYNNINKNIQNNNITRNIQNNDANRVENSQIPKALRNNERDDWSKIINNERENKNF